MTLRLNREPFGEGGMRCLVRKMIRRKTVQGFEISLVLSFLSDFRFPNVSKQFSVVKNWMKGCLSTGYSLMI